MTTFQGDNNQIAHEENAPEQLVKGMDINVSAPSVHSPQVSVHSPQVTELSALNEPLENTTGTDKIYDLSMLDNSPVIVIRWVLNSSDQGTFTYVSNNISQLGYNAKDILSGKVNWLTIIHPDDILDMRQAITHALANFEEFYIQNYRIKNALGEYIWIENRATIVRAEDGRVRYFQGLLTDITERKAVEAELYQKTSYLEILHETTLGLVQRLDLKSLFDSLVKRLANLVDADFASLNIVNEAEQNLEMVALAGLDTSILGSTVSKGEGLLGTVWGTNEAAYIDNYQTFEKRLDGSSFDEVKSLAAIPLTYEGKVIGVMGFGTKSITQFDENKRALLQSFAEIASVAIENAKIFENAQAELQVRQKLEVSLESQRNALEIQTKFRTELASLVEDSLSGKFAGNFYQTILERAIAIVPGADVGSLLVKGISGRFYFKAAVGYDLDQLEGLALTESEIYRDLSNDEPIQVFEANPGNLSSEKHEQLLSASNQSFKVALTIPISVYNETVALFSLDSIRDRNAFNDETIFLAKIFANQVTALWQRFTLEKKLQNNQNNYRQLFLEASQYSKELKIIDKIRNAIASKLELDELLDTVCASIADVFAYGSVYVGRIKGDYIEKVSSYGDDETITFARRIATGSKEFQKLEETRKAVSFPPDHPIFKNSPKHIQKTIIIFPLYAQGELIAVLAVGCESRNVSIEEKDLIEKIIDQLQIAIENAKLHAKVKNDLVRIKTHYRISRAMQENDRFSNFMDSIVEPICDALNARWAIIYKMDFEEGSVEHVSKAQLGENILPTLSFEELNSGLTGWAIRRQKVALSKDLSSDEREHPNVLKQNIDLGIGNALVIPLIHKNEVFGTMAVLRHQSNDDFTSEDISLSRALAEQVGAALANYQLRQAIEYQAFHDALTGLPNRLYIENTLKTVISEAQNQKSFFATMFLDLDGFKHVNDTLGHNIGDALLKAVSHRLKTNTKENDSLARMGGDEFAVIINAIETKEDAIRIAEKYLSVLQNPFQIGRHALKVGASIGISFYPDDGITLSNLLKHADSAMYQAKDSGKNSVRIFTPAIAKKVQDRLEMENDLRHVIERGELELHYQPQYCLQTNKRVGVEALLRWNHPVKGYISPVDFIPVSEESKLILDIGRWVIQEACNQNAAWQAQGHEAMTVAVNISALQFESVDFIEMVALALEKSGLNPNHLELEVTESVIMKDVETIIDRLDAVRAIGIKVSIDDFGTGYSSLQYLQKLPIDKLKIDRSFINDISIDSNSPILSSIFILAQSLGLQTIAEGVETQEQLDFVRLLGCDEVQGYYFSPAVPASKVWDDTSLENRVGSEIAVKDEEILSESTSNVAEAA